MCIYTSCITNSSVPPASLIPPSSHKQPHPCSTILCVASITTSDFIHTNTHTHTYTLLQFSAQPPSPPKASFYTHTHIHDFHTHTHARTHTRTSTTHHMTALRSLHHHPLTPRILIFHTYIHMSHIHTYEIEQSTRQDVISDGSLLYMMCNEDYSLSL